MQKLFIVKSARRCRHCIFGLTMFHLFEARGSRIGHVVEGDATRGTTTLVYLQLHISLYTGTVHVLSRVAGIRPLV
jgi:hypothetical protein